jgi:hypothetical protein
MKIRHLNIKEQLLYITILPYAYPSLDMQAVSKALYSRIHHKTYAYILTG